MTADQIDRLCQDWLSENYGESIASEYTIYSLVIPMWNSVSLNEALENFKLALSLAFGREQTFESLDYYEARQRLALINDETPVPDVFIEAFAMN